MGPETLELAVPQAEAEGEAEELATAVVAVFQAVALLMAAEGGPHSHKSPLVPASTKRRANAFRKQAHR